MIKCTPYSRSCIGISSSVMVCKPDSQACKSKFESHWVPYSFGLMPPISNRHQWGTRELRQGIIVPSSSHCLTIFLFHFMVHRNNAILDVIFNP